MNIDARNWLQIVFRRMTGDDKVSFETYLLELMKKNADLPYSFPITREFNPGTFELYSLDSLRTAGLSDRASSASSASSSGSSLEGKKCAIPMFTIYVRSDKNIKGKGSNDYFDTSSLQLLLGSSSSEKEETKPVLFQVASNFNCQENSSVYTSFISGSYLSGLMTDSTQGPSASSGAGLGAVTRLRYHLNSPINLLSAFSPSTGTGTGTSSGKTTSNFIEVTNGKLTNYSKDIDVSELNIDDVRIGLHTDLSANFDRSQRSKCYFHQRGKPIDQVFVSTIALASKTLKQKELDLTRFLLRAAYEGTYLAANYRKSERLVLTLIGGGVFYNPLELIIKAIARAHLDLDIGSELREVILPLFDPKHNHLEIIKILRQEGLPKDRIQVIFCD